MCENLRINFQKAIKEHSCDWCNEHINKGEEYFVHVYVFDKELKHIKMHIECKKAFDRECNDDYQVLIDYENFRGLTCWEKEQLTEEKNLLNGIYKKRKRKRRR